MIKYEMEKDRGGNYHLYLITDNPHLAFTVQNAVIQAVKVNQPAKITQDAETELPEEVER